MQIAVLGGGAMGSLFAGLLADAGRPTTLVTRSADHVSRVSGDGLVVETPAGDERRVRVPAVTDPAEAGRADLLVVCVKSYDTATAMADARPTYDDHTAVLTLQNGLGNAEALAELVPSENVLAGTTAHAATFLGPGRVRHAGRGPTRIGRYDGPTDDRTERVAALMTDAGIETTPIEAVADAVWGKVLVNVGINAATALARVPNGALAESAAGERLVERAVEEAAVVARAEGRSVPDDAAARTLRVARETATNRSSMRQDLEAGRRTEVEALHGAVVERAREHGVDAPVNRTLADLVRLAAAHASGSDGRGQS